MIEVLFLLLCIASYVFGFACGLMAGFRWLDETFEERKP